MMHVIVNKVESAQPKSTQAALHPTQRLFSSKQRNRITSLLLAAGEITLLAALSWAAPSRASTVENSEASSPIDVAQLTQPNSDTAQGVPAQPNTAQRPSPSQYAAPGTAGQPQASPRREVILTPSLPNRTVVPPPTTAFPYEESYTLGPGDEIVVNIFDVPELSGESGRYIVQLDGTINLTWAGVIRVQGLSVQQAEQAITQAYARFVRNPVISVSVSNTRALRVSVSGEIKRPGAYVISPEGATDNQVLISQTGTSGQVANQWPTVTKAIQSAGGLTQFADLRRVQVRRPLPDGSLEIIDVNLWELLRTGELNQDVRLRDRDALVIPTATTLNDSEALVSGAANFAPETIRVNVIGEVPTPGVIEVTTNTPMNQALLAAGGFKRPRARTSKVELVRLNSNGTAVRRVVTVDLAAGINEATNPALRDYDTIIVSRNGAATFSDNAETVLSPFDRFFGIFNTIFGTANTITDLGNNDN